MGTKTFETISLGFIGAGRITRIMLQAFKNRKVSFRQIMVTDTNPDVQKDLGHHYPDIHTSPDGLRTAVLNDIVFIALHPPVILETLTQLKQFLDRDTIVVSLAPKLTMEKIGRNLNDHKRIARVIPNAPSIINQGYNPFCFSDGLSDRDKDLLAGLFDVLGSKCEVEEAKLEAYAIVTAMSPTYFWFQVRELYNIGIKLGLTQDECRKGIAETVKASIDTLFNTDLSSEEVFDLIPVKPLADHEEEILKIYQTVLLPLYEKIQP